MELLKIEFIFLVLFTVELIYFRLAGRFGIVDVPNDRSSHEEVTLRGGGVVFYVAAIAYFFVIGFYYPWTMLGLTIVAAVSFADDIRSLPDSVRLAAQFVGVLLALYEFGGMYTFGWWWLIPALIIGVGVLNAFNFMDGINGLTGGYSLVVLSALLYVNNYVDKFVDNRLLGVMLCACLVFCFFNFRTKATCFAGDVGAVSIAFMIVSLMAKLMMKTQSVGWIAFLAVYGVDVVLTIGHRIMLHENLGQAHRKHMYQILANELKIEHTDVALIYMAVQALVCMVYLVLPSVWTAFWLVLALSVVYVLFMRKYYHLHEETLDKKAMSSATASDLAKRSIPFSPPDMSEAEIQHVADTLRSGWITTGPKTKEFEKRIAEFCHTERAVCLNSATACMESILRVLGVGPGDEVITCAYTYTASASVACHVGAKVVLVDAQKDSVEMDYDQLEAAITERTKVVIPVDLGGIVCDYDRIFEVVEKKRHLFHPANEIQARYGRVIVLADAAHAFGAQWHGKMCGEIADFTSFSFHAVKNLTTAEGGALTWRRLGACGAGSNGLSSSNGSNGLSSLNGSSSSNGLNGSSGSNGSSSSNGLNGLERFGMVENGAEWNEKLYKEFQLLSLHGQNKDALAKTRLGAWEYDIVAPYYKCNMTDIMAGIGLAQLERYPQLLARRKEIVQRYDEAIDKLNANLDANHQVKYLNHYGDNHQGSGHLYIVRMLGLTPEQRNEVIVKMAERGVACNVHYKPLPMMTAYKAMGFDIKDFPNAYHLFENEITLPLHTKLTDEDVEYVIASFKEALGEVRNG